MKIIAERVIAVLKANSALVTLLGSSKNIFARSLAEKTKRPAKYVSVEVSLGADLNYTAGQEDDFEVEIGVSRKGANAYSNLMLILSSVDALINKQELTLSTATFKIISIYRTDCPTRGVLIDDKNNEFYITIKYSYIIDENE